jgi:polyisoprenoid-binding protein YceI
MKPLVYALSLLVALHAANAQILFKIVPGRGDNRVQFTSEAPMETVVGTTHTMTGFVEINPASDGLSSRGEVHVDLASLKTGMELRDRHMRENHLETDKFPEAAFTISTIAFPNGGLPDGQRTSVMVKGKLLLHGVERDIEPQTYLTYHETPSGYTLHVEANFTVKLADYQIPRPQFLTMRLSEEQTISVNFTAVNTSASALK